MKLERVTENVYYIPNPVNIGVIVDSGKAFLIDTGLDEEVGRRIFKLMSNHKLKISGIFNTHSHADHFGGNSYILKKVDARVYATSIESGIIQSPYLEPLYLFSAHPVRELTVKFIMAKPSRVDHIVSHEIEFENLKLDVISLKGHSPNQAGIGVDGVLFCADSVFSERVIKKYKIPLFMDIESQKESLKFLENSNFDCYIPAHAEKTEDIIQLVEANRKVIEEVESFIISIAKGKTTEEILRDVCKNFRIGLKSFSEYYLMLSTIKAYLSYLHNKGLIKGEFKDLLYWSSSE
ncbi:hypothetical protein Asulf_00732 [Archaeoglobus sulfaticallidus PM70-1]|uniref:Metallo-beta-lactamase domain-containing protein n=1 Tax=Archaeoglobus sulfaticallidus PM70-1 TaxID=387631 RepID=N0BJR9_9EURY|nr:MBL fold metallo-hydrolase [Archaeoglobus sulfaticallidus]AGK60746.1 hypothetical protein Asulf_00732 [Archaeoglobus sulfaticallidus PM70-1]